MAQLASGTVTFRTDIEGLTRLLPRLRGRYAEVLGQHQCLWRAAFAEHDGGEVATEGDALFVAFARAIEAIAAAVKAQRALASRNWPQGAQVRVPYRRGGRPDRVVRWAGRARAGRICAAGHGGQVLTPSSTRALVADELPADV